MSRAVVSPIVVNHVEPYDLLLCALGYESRARYIASQRCTQAKRHVAIGFDYHIEGEVESNREVMEDLGYFNWLTDFSVESPYISDSCYREIVADVFADTLEFASEDTVRIAIDISSLSLLRLAIIVEELCDLMVREGPRLQDVQVEFLYAVGTGHGIGTECEQIEFAGPVTNGFSGWSRDPRVPVVAIFGLGFEYEKSIGAFELLSPATTYAFATTGTDEAHDLRIGNANRLFLPLVPPGQRIAFEASKPMDCYHKLRSVASGALREGRPVFVPMGPKIFGLSCLLIAREYYPRMSVWRISTGRHGKPTEVAASGEIVGVQVSFRSLLDVAAARNVKPGTLAINVANS